MNKDTKEIIGKISSTLDESVVNQFISILELPDEDFNRVYKDIMTETERVFHENETRNAILAELKTVPSINLKEELNSMNEIIEEIKENKELSDNKKSLIISIINNSAEIISSVVTIPRSFVTVDVQRISEDAILPRYAHNSDAGADIFAIEETVLKPHTTQIIKTGLKIAVPIGYEVQIRPRSGMSLKTSIRIANAPGTIKVA